MVVASPCVRVSDDKFCATLDAGGQQPICHQIKSDPRAALDIAASYAAANPVFRSRLVKAIRSKCVCQVLNARRPFPGGKGLRDERSVSDGSDQMS